MVSVPLRGCVFEIKQVKTFKFFLSNVSVPLRGCVFEITKKIEDLQKAVLFPSPCGDVFLKLIDDGKNPFWNLIVSVPLRGCVFEIDNFEKHRTSIAEVSVPLRGCVFEILASESLAVPASKWHFAARMVFPSFFMRHCILKTFAIVTALGAARILLLSIAHCLPRCNHSTP